MFRIITLAIFLIWSFFNSWLSAQTADPLGFIDSLTNIIVNEEAQSAVQEKAVNELRDHLEDRIRNDRGLSNVNQTRLWVTYRNLNMRRGDYLALIPKNDISEKVLLLEESLKSYRDSIAIIQVELINIIEDSISSTNTKEKAVNVLASIQDENAISFLLENESSLQFSSVHPENEDELDNEMYRTVMLALSDQYL
ncbi:MAG: hypothetical protein AAF741_05425 [Bacteroidota bacterium]